MKVAKPGSVDHHAGPFILIYIRFLNLCQVFYTFSLCSSHAMLRVVLVMSCPYGSAGTSLRIMKNPDIKAGHHRKQGKKEIHQSENSLPILSEVHTREKTLKN